MNRKTLIVDDNELFAQLVGSVVNSAAGFELCRTVSDARSAAEFIGKDKPDVILLSGELSSHDAAGFLRQIIPQYAVPVIVYSSNRAKANAVLKAGAADFLMKPKNSGNGYDSFKLALSKAMNNALNLRQISCEGKLYELKRTKKKTKGDRLILIGGSAGSTDALPMLLKDFTPDMPPTAVCLHLPQDYTEMFANRLKSEAAIEIAEARNAMRLKSGSAVIAQGAKHLRIVSNDTGYFALSESGEKISGHCPSVDALFLSAAELEHTKIIAVLLTGMGSDGAKGLLALRKAGAYTIGQDEKSSLVYGMPKAAYDMGAVCRQCSLDGIAAAIKQKLKEWE